MISLYRWYLTADGRAVKEGHPDAHMLLLAEGDEIDDAKASELGVCNCPDHDEAVDEPRLFTAPPSNKVFAPENKEAQTPKRKRTK